MEPLEIAALVERFVPDGHGKAASLRVAIRKAVASRLLKPRDELPSTRKTAKVLAMSRNSVIEAYEALHAEGVIETRRGARPKICALPEAKPVKQQAKPKATLSKRGRALCMDHKRDYAPDGHQVLIPGLPDPNLFPRDEWARTLRRAARLRHDGSDMYENYRGLPRLREALARHLKRTRGVSLEPDRLFVTTGTQGGMSLIADLVSDPGDIALIEDPGYLGARALFNAKDLKVQPLPDDLSKQADDTALIYITPSTQSPNGERMKLDRRLDLLHHAARSGAVLLEDDYDSDFVWAGRDVPPVFALDKNERVVLHGTVSKSLLPGLRLGWLAVPDSLVDAVAQGQRSLGLAASTQIQASLADFIDTGLFARHLRKSSRTYQERMNILTAEITCELGDRVSVSPPDGGLQILIEFSPDTNDKNIAEAMQAKGFHVPPVSRYCLKSPMRGLVVGFAQANEANSKAFCRALAQVLDGR